MLAGGAAAAIVLLCHAGQPGDANAVATYGVPQPVAGGFATDGDDDEAQLQQQLQTQQEIQQAEQQVEEQAQLDLQEAQQAEQQGQLTEQQATLSVPGS